MSTSTGLKSPGDAFIIAVAVTALVLIINFIVIQIINPIVAMLIIIGIITFRYEVKLRNLEQKIDKLTNN